MPKQKQKETMESVSYWLTTAGHDACPAITDMRSDTPLEKTDSAFYSRYQLRIASI